MEISRYGYAAALEWPSEHPAGTELRARVVAVHFGPHQQTLLVETSGPELCFFVVTDLWCDDIYTLGYISTSGQPGRLVFRPQKHPPSAPTLTVFGPCFSMFELRLWQSPDATDAGSYSIAEDVSENRWRKLGGAYFRPEWKFALALYVDLLSHDMSADRLSQVAALFSGPAIDLLSASDKRAVRVFLARMKSCSPDELSALCDEVLDILGGY